MRYSIGSPAMKRSACKGRRAQLCGFKPQRGIDTRVQLQQHRPADIGNAGRNHQRLCKRQTALWLRGSGQWDAPALHLLLHLLRIIQADDTIRIVDEEVETFQEILAENPPDARIRYLYLAQRMNQKKRVLQN